MTHPARSARLASRVQLASPAAAPTAALPASLRATGVALVATLAATLAACTHVPPANLADARSAVVQARSDPAAARNAPLELEQADRALRTAENAWNKDHDEKETQHLAYLARQRAAIATTLGAQRQTEQDINDAGADRERVRTETERRRATAAQREAATARQMTAEQVARATMLQRQLEALKAKKTDRGMVVTLPDVLFATGHATLNPGAQRTVDRLADILRQYPERRVLIEGHTDNVGSADMNLGLSQRRAESFRRAMMNRGVAADRMEVRAYGQEYPVADNSTAAGRAQNRRVEVLFSDADGKLPAR